MGNGSSMGSPPMTAAQTLLERVVSGGYCIGCGACAAVSGSPLVMRMDEHGRYRPTTRPGASGHSSSSLLHVCPFFGLAPNEDDLAQEYRAGCQHDSRLGYYRGLFAGYVTEGEFRGRGASGGMATWLLHELFQEAMVDGVIHVRPAAPDRDGRPLFRYTVSRSASEILGGAKSRYYPVELSDVLAEVRDRPGHYALIGLPCFIKAVKTLARVEPWVAGRIRYYVGLVCGHLKSAAFAESIAWQLGVEPWSVAAIDFRKKLSSRSASEYGVEVTAEREEGLGRIVRPMRGLLGSDWGQGLFMYEACDYCDDVFAEGADVVLGDAWLPRYSQDPLGTNIVVVRRLEFSELLSNAAEAGRLHLEPLTPDEAAQSQQGALRHRREGLAYRLHLKEKVRAWYPPKRVRPEVSHLSKKRRRIYELRTSIARNSHEAFREARWRSDWTVFEARMSVYLRRYELAYNGTWRRIGRLVLLCRQGLSLLRQTVKSR